MKKEIFNLVSLNEGFKGKTYVCPASHLTIGYGFNLDAIEMPIEVGNLWLSMLLDEIEEKLKKNIIFYSVLNDARKAVLIDMAYNMGISGLIKFKNMLYAMQDKRFDKAADEMLESKWATQVKNRAKKLSTMVRTGIF